MTTPNDPGTIRKHACQELLYLVRQLAMQTAIDQNTKDMLARVLALLGEVNQTVETTIKAWEKRDFWLRADQFQREWGWASRVHANVEKILVEDSWENTPFVLADLGSKLSQTKYELPKRMNFTENWKNQYENWQKIRKIQNIQK